MRKIENIIIHCTATRPDADVDIDHVRTWHVKGNGWRDVGYHYLIKLDGTVQHGRHISKTGAGVKGHNSHSVHIAYVGGCDDDLKPKNTLNADQRAALYQLTTSIVRVLGPLDVIGHNDLTDEKACPSFKVGTELAQLVKWCQTGEGDTPQSDAKQRQPEAVAPRQHCRRCHRRVRM